MQFSKMALGMGRHLPSLHKGRLVLALTLPLVATGCSSVPDAMNPAEWYRSTVDYVAGEDEEGKAADAKTAEAKTAEAAEGDKKFPPLPGDAERAKAEQAQETQAVAQGLVADTQEGRYSSETVARQGEAVSPLQPEVSAKAASAPAPASTTAAPAPMQQQAAAPMPQAQRPLDTTGMSLQEIYQANLAQRRPYSATSAPSRPGGQAQSMATGGYYPTQTVVISSSGVSQGGQASMSRLQMGGTATHQSRMTASVVAKNGAHDLSEFNPASVSNSYKVAVIQFANGAAGLTSSERAILRKVVSLHKERGGTIRVVGHASSRTRDMEPVKHKMVNWNVSTSRADRVAKEFLRLGVSAGNLYVGAMADNEPVYYEVMPAGEAGNRRAEIYIDY